jgi:hypothetical protein
MAGKQDFKLPLKGKPIPCSPAFCLNRSFICLNVGNDFQVGTHFIPWFKGMVETSGRYRLTRSSCIFSLIIPIKLDPVGL